MPITPTKTASHAAFVAGDRGAKTNNKSDAIGQIDAETAHTIPRPRSDKREDVRRAIGAFVTKENRKQSPLAGELDQEE